jgi:MOSC domain-containing protein YiiM
MRSAGRLRDDSGMKVVSVNVGRPRTVEWGGRKIRSAIWKAPVEGRVLVRGENVEGDKQSDRRVHGGPDKAVYLYPAEHYAFWRPTLGELPWGAFGENLTVEGLLETDVRPGDVLRVGSTELEITDPRMPCYKLQVRFNRFDIVQRFMESGRTGFYAGIALEGDVAAGDAIERVAAGDGPTIAEVVELKRRRRA